MKKKSGFTLIELLVSLGIVAVLLAALLPAVQMAREAARRTHCQSNLRQLTLAFLNFESARKRFPPGYSGTLQAVARHAYGPGSNFGHLMYIYPFLEQGTLYDEMLSENPYPGWDHPRSWSLMPYAKTIREHRVTVLQCPSLVHIPGPRFTNFEPSGIDSIVYIFETEADEASAYTTYLGNGGVRGKQDLTPTSELGVFYVNSKTRIGDILDGASNTILIGEVHGDEVWKGTVDSTEVLHYPASSPANSKHGFWQSERSDDIEDHFMASAFGSHHAGGIVNLAYVDGSVRPTSVEMAQSVLVAASTIQGKESSVE